MTLINWQACDRAERTSYNSCAGVVWRESASGDLLSTSSVKRTKIKLNKNYWNNNLIINFFRLTTFYYIYSKSQNLYAI